MFNKQLVIGMAAVLALSSSAWASHKAGHTQNNPDAPGQNRACLVTTSGGAEGEVLSGKWLPRKAAEAQADNETTFVGTHPGVQTKEGCEGLPGSI
jgi:type 1 fimbria pilin